MSTSFSVDVRLNLMNELSRGMQGLNTSLRGAQSQVDRLSRSFSQLFAFKELESGGKAVVGFVGGMAKSAMDLQSAMVNVRIATNASTQQMQQMHDLVLRTSQAGLMTSVEAGNMAAQMARAGFSPRDLTALMPTVSKFGDIMHAQRNMSFEASTDFGVELAHFYGAYNEASAKPIIEMAAKAMQMQIGTPQEFYTQLRAFGKTAGKLGMAPAQQMQLTALGMNMGDKSFGTELMNIMIGSIPKTASLSAVRQTAQTRGLADLGLTQGGKNLAYGGPGGTFDINFVLSQLMKRSHEMPPAEFAAAVMQAFNRRGGRGAMNLADEQTLKRLADMPAAFAKLQGLDGMHDTVMNQANSQLTLLTTNVKNVGTAIGEGLLPQVTKWTALFAGKAGDLANKINDNPSLKAHLGTIAEGVGLGGAAMVGVGAVGVAISTLRIMGAALKNGALPVTVVNGSALGLGGGGGGGGTFSDQSVGNNKIMALFRGIGAAKLGWEAGRFLGEMGLDDKIQKMLPGSEMEFLLQKAGLIETHSSSATDAKVKAAHDARVAAGSDASLTVHGNVHIHADSDDTVRTLTKKIQRAAAKQSGTSRSGPSTSPYSSNNKGQ